MSKIAPTGFWTSHCFVTIYANISRCLDCMKPNIYTGLQAIQALSKKRAPHKKGIRCSRPSHKSTGSSSSSSSSAFSPSASPSAPTSRPPQTSFKPAALFPFGSAPWPSPPPASAHRNSSPPLPPVRNTASPPRSSSPSPPFRPCSSPPSTSFPPSSTQARALSPNTWASASIARPACSTHTPSRSPTLPARACRSTSWRASFKPCTSSTRSSIPSARRTLLSSPSSFFSLQQWCSSTSSLAASQHPSSIRPCNSSSSSSPFSP